MSQSNYDTFKHLPRIDIWSRLMLLYMYQLFMSCMHERYTSSSTMLTAKGCCYDSFLLIGKSYVKIISITQTSRNKVKQLLPFIPRIASCRVLSAPCHNCISISNPLTLPSSNTYVDLTNFFFYSQSRCVAANPRIKS